MKIVFSGIGCGFANNGGTKTVVSCVNTLHDMGHEACIATQVYDFTWFELRGQRLKRFPDDADAIIATAVSTVKPLLEFKTRAKKYWYIRGWETWAASKSEIIELIKSIPIIVNSEWLKHRVAKYTDEPPIVYPGLDTDIFYPERPGLNETVTIGGLYHSKKLKRFPMWKSVIQKVLDRTNNVKVKLLGNDPKPNLPFECGYVRQPRPRKHRRFYNNTNIWLFTSENEGLHIPPMEAGLCECAIVGTDIGGVKDYAEHNETALLGKNQEDLVKHLLKLVHDYMARESLGRNLRKRLLEKIGDRKTNMEKLVKILG